ncbi:MAG TPA: hypothetical protein VMB79_00865 [Jatrophihabitans sp.]|nr:hypothetical protein [Jatrophihabitans sp.]
MGFDLGVLLWAAILIVTLTLLMRWVFAPSSRPRTGRPQTGPDADLGLLVTVLPATTRSNALAVKNLLISQGIRSSVSRLDVDSYDVLVFRTDLANARAVLDRAD